MGSISSNCVSSTEDDIKASDRTKCALGIIPAEVARKMRRDGIDNMINTKIRIACETGETSFDLDFERMPHQEWTSITDTLESLGYDLEHFSRSLIRVHIVMNQK